MPQSYQLTATIALSDATNTAAATVDANGLVTAVGNGTAVITAETADGTGVAASCTVMVIDPSNGIKLNQTSASLEALETIQLTAAITPANAANKTLVWACFDEVVASVDQNGLVTANAKGTATITFTAADGNGASASCNITVTNMAIW